MDLKASNVDEVPDLIDGEQQSEINMYCKGLSEINNIYINARKGEELQTVPVEHCLFHI